MDWFQLIAALLSLAALFSYLNHRFLGLPSTIGLMLIGLLASLGVVAAGNLFPGFERAVVELLARIDFDKVLMEGLLGFLLFAGALHVDINDLVEQKLVIALLATLGLLASTAIIGGVIWLVLDAVGRELPFIVCLLFGALISPTDPIAVLAVVKKLGAPKSLETKIAGESLFNDGVAVVLFLAILGVAGLSGTHGVDASAGEGDLALAVIGLFALETLGGALFGLLAGLGVYGLMRSIESYEVEILLSLALVAGGYALALALHVSGPIAMVVAGLLIGNQGRRFAMSQPTREHLDTFWLLVDEILNAVLFVLIGLEFLLIPIDSTWLAMGLVAIVAVLGARVVAVSLPVLALRPLRDFTPHAVKVLTWGGLRGGISVALALSLKTSLGARSPAAYEGILVMTYVVVVFSILVQGLTMAPLLRRLGLARPVPAAAHHEKDPSPGAAT
jgi:CPA1 family monovalent cation:H+ antiporter